MLAALLTFSAVAEAQQFDLEWVAQTGGPVRDHSLKVTTDAAGNIYEFGFFGGTVDFDPGPSVFELTASTFRAPYVRKSDSDGNLLYAFSRHPSSTFLPARSLALDGADNLYEIGEFNGTFDFDLGAGVSEITCSGNGCLFILRVDAAGQFDFVKSVSVSGALSFIQASRAVVDSSGDLIILGTFEGTVDFDPGAGVVELTNQGALSDSFILKLDASGNFVFVRAFGGVNSRVAGITLGVGPTDTIYTGGVFDNTADFDPGPGTMNLSATGAVSSYILKLDASGNLIFAGASGGVGSDVPGNLAVDSTGAVYTVGQFQSTVDFDPGPGTVTPLPAGVDIFIQKLDAAGDLLFLKAIGGIGNDFAEACVIDGAENLYVGGIFEDSVDFDPGTGHRILTTSGSSSVFMMALGTGGNLLSADAFSGDNIMGLGGSGLALGTGGAVVMSGGFFGTADFDPGAGKLELTSAGDSDGFVLSLSPHPRISTNPASGIRLRGRGGSIGIAGSFGNEFPMDKGFARSRGRSAACDGGKHGYACDRSGCTK